MSINGINQLIFVIETHCFLWAINVNYKNCVLKTLSDVWVWYITGINLECECQTTDGWLFMSGRNPSGKISMNIISSCKVFMCSGAVGLGAAPQCGKFRVRLPLEPLEILKWLIILSASNRNFLGGKVRPERRTDNPAILVVPHVTLRIETQHSTSLWVFMTFYGKALPYSL
jgi:hypothetical protein